MQKILKAIYDGELRIAESRAQEAELEAFQASAAPLRLVLQTFDGIEPILMVIIRVNDFQTERLRISRAFVLADLIFLKRIYVRITIIYDRSDVVLHHRLDDGT